MQVARAARLLFLIQPIIYFYICDIVAAVAIAVFLYRPNDFLSIAALKGGPIRAHYVPYVRYNCT